MKLISKISLSIMLSASTLSANALDTESNLEIDYIHVYKNNAIITLAEEWGKPGPSCMNDRKHIMIPNSTAEEKNLYSAILTAFTAGKPVGFAVHGDNARCHDWGSYKMAEAYKVGIGK